MLALDFLRVLTRHSQTDTRINVHVTLAVSGGQGGADERGNPASPGALAREGFLSSQTSACLRECSVH